MRKPKPHDSTHRPAVEGLEGVVLSLHGRDAFVDLAGETIRCTLRKRLFDKLETFTNPVAVGDRVLVTVEARQSGMIEAVLPRSAYLSRRQAATGKEQILVANVEVAVIVCSLLEPTLRPRLIDRVLVAAERGGFDSIIVLSKVDLVSDESQARSVLSLYSELGYDVLCTSVSTQRGIAELRERIAHRASVFAGQSGVGKSSLLNALYPEIQQKTQTVTERWQKGKHTTSAARLFRCADGTSVVDTPGVRSFAVAGLEPSDIAMFFVEFAPHIDGCHYRACTHDHEPDCAVKEALEAGRIRAERYESYLRIIRGDEEEEEG